MIYTTLSTVSSSGYFCSQEISVVKKEIESGSDDEKPLLFFKNATPRTDLAKRQDNTEESSESEGEGNIFLPFENKAAPRTDLAKHRANITEIIMNSNATPIRRYGGVGYTCCFCEEQFADPANLKTHTLENHPDVSEANFMKSMNMSEYVVKLDITALHCNLCKTEMDTLENFIDHLKNTHSRRIFTDIKNQIFPFKFNGDTLKCVMCPNTFERYRVLVAHMHCHYKNFCCNICNAGFVNRNSFTQHAEHHRTGKFACEYCPKILKTHLAKRNHERSVHTHLDAVNKCGYCIETFKDYRKREIHLTEVHGVKYSTPKCTACDKVFTNRKLLSIHVKRDHLMERPHKCSECDMAFFSSTHLKNHMVKHTGTRDFKCTICHKSYGRKKTLNSHMRVHEQERYKCVHCDGSFVQKCSWRIHMRTKHGVVV